MNKTYYTCHVNLGKKSYKVITPTEEILGLHVVSAGIRSVVICADEGSLQRLSELLKILTRMKDIIVYLPSKQNPLTEYLMERWSTKGTGNDLVFMHHSLQFNTKDWKQLRSLMKKGSYQTKEVIPAAMEQRKTKPIRYWYREHKDFLDIKERYDTLFLVGSPMIFQHMSEDAISIKKEGRELFERFPGYHEHEHIDDYTRRVYDKKYKHYGWALSLDFYDEELWGS
ncbi:hypothetical protein M3231_11045 [Neobacillus mesonae]|nr:hypothetical protein [Neobacillus mesonae]